MNSARDAKPPRRLHGARHVGTGVCVGVLRRMHSTSVALHRNTSSGACSKLFCLHACVCVRVCVRVAWVCACVCVGVCVGVACVRVCAGACMCVRVRVCERARRSKQHVGWKRHGILHYRPCCLPVAIPLAVWCVVCGVGGECWGCRVTHPANR